MGELAAFMDRIGSLVGSLETLLVSIAFVAGLTAAYVGLRKVSHAAALGPAGALDRQVGLVSIVAATIFLSFPAFVVMSGYTLFGTGTATPQPSDIFAYSPELLQVVSDDTSRRVLYGCLKMVQFVGLVGFYKAVTLSMKAPYHPGMGLYGRAFTHLVGGTLAWNIVLFSGSLEALFLGGQS